MDAVDVGVVGTIGVHADEEVGAGLVGDLGPLDVGDVDVLRGAGHDHLDAGGLERVAQLEPDGQDQLALRDAGDHPGGAAADLGLLLAGPGPDRLEARVALGLMAGVDDHHLLAARRGSRGRGG